MAQTPTVYRWDDPGAPQVVNGNYSELINIIDKCLVTGYGSKQPLGWIKELDETLACSYKNKGSGHSVVFSSASGVNDEKGVRVQSARNVFDADNLERAGYKQAFKVFPDKNTAWVIIGTTKAFYCFFCYAGSYQMPSTLYQAGLFVGDLSNAITGDSSKFIAVCSFISEDLDLSSGSAGTNYGSNIMFLNDRQYDGYNTPIHIYDTDGAEHFGKYIPTLIKDTVKKPTPETESIPVNYLEPILLIHQDYGSSLDRDSKPVFESKTRPALRGQLPGLFTSLIGHPLRLIWPAIVNYGNEFLILKSVDGASNRLLINTEVWDD